MAQQHEPRVACQHAPRVACSRALPMSHESRSRVAVAVASMAASPRGSPYPRVSRGVTHACHVTLPTRVMTFASQMKAAQAAEDGWSRVSSLSWTTAALALTDPGPPAGPPRPPIVATLHADGSFRVSRLGPLEAKPWSCLASRHDDDAWFPPLATRTGPRCVATGGARCVVTRAAGPSRRTGPLRRDASRACRALVTRARPVGFPVPHVRCALPCAGESGPASCGSSAEQVRPPPMPSQSAPLSPHVQPPPHWHAEQLPWESGCLRRG